VAGNRFENDGPSHPGDEFFGLARDPDTEDDVTQVYGYDEASSSPEIEELDQNPLLVEQIATEVRNGLTNYGWLGMEAINGEKLLEICERLGIPPEPNRALVALLDIGFSIEEDNFNARAMEEIPTLEEIERRGEVIEDFADFQTEQNVLAYDFFRNGLKKDIIIQLPLLRVQHEHLKLDIKELQQKKPATMEEFDEQTENMRELKEMIAKVEALMGDLISIEEVKERREHAFRRMRWLLRQEFMAQPISEYFQECKKIGKTLDFDTLAGVIAGRYSDEPVVTNIKKKEDGANDEEADEPTSHEAEESEQVKEKYDVDTQMVRKYMPGIIDKLLDKQNEEMVDMTGWPQGDVRRAQIKLRRLQQAQALCRNVFQNDITDRIYLGMPVTPLEYGALQVARRRLYVFGDTGVIKEFTSFLPGSSYRKVKDKALDDTPLSRFSGRSKNEVLREIDDVISEHPDMESDYIAGLMEACEKGALPETSEIELSVIALKILEKLAFKENYSVRPFISAT
jgi:hypothetical protein